MPFTNVKTAEAGKQLSTAVEDMGDLRPRVVVKSIRLAEDGNAATAMFSMTWDVDGSTKDWAYTTTAKLTLAKDAWSVGWSPTVLEPSLAAGERLVVRKSAAKRGEILGAGGAVLVTDRPVFRVGIDKTKVAPEQAGASAKLLAKLLDIESAAFAQQVTAAGPKAFVEAIVLRTDAPDLPDSGHLAAIPGAAEIPDELPLAPTREFARPILGTVGPATAELIGASKGRLRAGDITGLSGLQQIHNEQLSGQPGLMVQAVPPEGSDAKARELFSRDGEPGKTLATTLDPARQSHAETLLARVKSASAIVAIRPSTGEVVAAASGPGGNGYSTALLGQYAPGSAFKVVTTLGLLRSGLTQASVIPCTPTTTVDGRSFKNYDDYPARALGDISLREAIANSCNTALIAQRTKVPQATLAQAGAALGLGLKGDLGMPSFAGSVPAQADGTAHAASMIGQGQVEASPLAMAVVAASIARGQAVAPRLLQGPSSKTAKVDQQGDGPVTTGEAKELRAMMRAVVTEGSATFLGDVPGGAVAAKTGTAEYGTADPPRTHAWMIAIQGDLAVAVFVEDGASGSRTAGPILEQFLRGNT